MKTQSPYLKVIKMLGSALVTILSLCFTCVIVLVLIFAQGSSETVYSPSGSNHQLTTQFNMFITNVFSESLGNILKIDKMYFLNENEPIAPEPNQDKFGQTTNPADLQ